MQQEQLTEFQCFEYSDIVTPINVEKFEQQLRQAEFDSNKIQKLITGFKEGFDIGYEGKCTKTETANNLPFRVGTLVDMWNKIMKEVSMSRYAGPFTQDQIPYDKFIQSPIGLVPKAKGKTRLIFHLSYNFGETNSINANTPKDKCTVKYNDLDHAVQTSVNILNALGFSTHLFYGKADLVSAFRILPIKPDQKHLMKAKHPITKIWYFFIDKCLPFGSSISCAHFQLFSDALACIMEHKLKMRVTNYLDDFLFIAESEEHCNDMLTQFLETCQEIGCPVSEEKTEPANEVMVFLGVLLDGKNHVLAIPKDKRIKGLRALRYITDHKKVTIKAIQKVTGFLNFLQCAIVPGRTFTRALYDKLKIKDKNGNLLKEYHHVSVSNQLKADCNVWKMFLDTHDKLRFCRPFIDLQESRYATTLNFYSDSSLNERFGFGVIFRNHWAYGRWGRRFIKEQKPSIEFLELFALVAGIIIWEDDVELANTRIIIFCDNEAVVNMVNKMTSNCPKCMKLIRILAYNCLLYNRRVFVQHVRSESNVLADALSHMNFTKFWTHAPSTMDEYPTDIPDVIWPIDKLWFD